MPDRQDNRAGLDILLAPLVVGCALLMKWIWRAGDYRMMLSRSIFFRIGVSPIRDHHYECWPPNLMRASRRHCGLYGGEPRSGTQSG
jgi:hypothetical protein